jgi:hypothetical protein
MIRKLIEAIFGEKEKKSFLETHKYKIEKHTHHYFLEVKGREYHTWTDITEVLADKGLEDNYKGREFSHLVKDKQRAVADMELFCEYIVAMERGEVETSMPLEGNLKEFYIIENL